MKTSDQHPFEQVRDALGSTFLRGIWKKKGVLEIPSLNLRLRRTGRDDKGQEIVVEEKIREEV